MSKLSTCSSLGCTRAEFTPHVQASHRTSSAAQFPGFARQPWAGNPWTAAQTLFWQPAQKHGISAAKGFSDLFSGMLSQEASGAQKLLSLKSCYTLAAGSLGNYNRKMTSRHVAAP